MNSAADKSLVEDRKDVEAWADALLDQHRTTPRSSAAAGTDNSSLENDPLVRLAAKLSGEEPDPLMLERLRRHRERYARLAKIDAVVWGIALVALCVLGFIGLSFL